MIRTRQVLAFFKHFFVCINGLTNEDVLNKRKFQLFMCQNKKEPFCCMKIRFSIERLKLKKGAEEAVQKI